MESKIEFMTTTGNVLHSIAGHQLKHVDDFKYLGSYVSDIMKDFNTRKGMVWSACIIKLQKVWTSVISENMKVKFFRACVEPVLLYGSETWTMNKQFQKRLNGLYTTINLQEVRCSQRMVKIGCSWGWSVGDLLTTQSGIIPGTLTLTSAITKVGSLPIWRRE